MHHVTGCAHTSILLWYSNGRVLHALSTVHTVADPGQVDPATVRALPSAKGEEAKCLETVVTLLALFQHQLATVGARLLLGLVTGVVEEGEREGGKGGSPEGVNS